MNGELTPQGYMPRLVDAEVRAVLDGSPGLVIDGPKSCGKTWTALHHARSAVMLDRDLDARLAVAVNPSRLLEGPYPRLLDEWQTAPDVWNAVRAACDDGTGPGRFILTGSAVPADDTTRHSGAGRIRRIRMRPMSLLESGASTGAVSFEGLLEGATCDAGRPDMDFGGVIDSVCRGGWPRLLGLTTNQTQQELRAYLEELCRTDISAVDATPRDPVGVNRLLASLARNVATEASVSKLAADTGGERPVNRTTAKAYLQALERLFVLEDLPRWPIHLRSRKPLRGTPKRHLVDPSLAAARLRATPDRLATELSYLGFLFESLVVRDLRIYSQGADSVVWHYRDADGLEVDAIVEAGDGRWIAVDIKLGGSQLIDAGASSLLRLRAKAVADGFLPSAKLLVVTATGYGYERADGVAVAPVTALGP